MLIKILRSESLTVDSRQALAKKLIEFEENSKTTRATMKKLEALGCVRIVEEEIYRNPLDILNINEKEDLNKLSDLQQKVYDGISKQIKDEYQRL